jgi:hypothetical protein
MDRFLVKIEHSKTEHKKRQRAVVPVMTTTRSNDHQLTEE